MAPPLHEAAKLGDAAAIRRLVAAGLDANALDPKTDGWTALHLAAQHGHVSAIRALLGAGARVDSMGKNDMTPLHLAAHSGHVDAIRALLAAGAAVGSMGKNAWTPLHYAAYGGHVDAIWALLGVGAAVGSESKGGWTPVHLAAESGHAGAIRALVSAGASLTCKDKFGQSPLEIAREGNHAEAARALQEATAEAEGRQAEGRRPAAEPVAAVETPLQAAISHEVQLRLKEQEAQQQFAASQEELARLRASADQPHPDLDSALEGTSPNKTGTAAAMGTALNTPVYSEAEWRRREAQPAAAEEARLRTAVSHEVVRLQEQLRLKEQESQRQLAALQEELARLRASAGQPRPVAPEIPSIPPTPASQLGTGLTSCEVVESEVVLVEKLGQGSFGEVWRGQWYGSDVAVKKLRAEAAGVLPAEVLASLRQESSLMASLRHDRIVGLRGVCFDPPLIVMELCGRRALDAVLQAAQSDPAAAQKLTWPRRLGILVDVAWGMTFLHSRNVLHRDLKSPNILVDDSWRAKVADFNLSKLMEIRVGSAAASSRARSTYSSINPRWLAPELVLEGEDGAHGHATPASDCFAFGLVLWEVLTWQYPWANLNENQIVGRLYQHRRPPIPDRSELPGPNSRSWVGLEQYISLMQRCWDDNPAARPSFNTVATELQALLG